MNILITGNSSFLVQSWRSSFLIKDNNIISVGRDKSNTLNIDLLTDFKINTEISLVIHAAGKAHSIPRTRIEKKEFFDVNFLGTQNLLKALQQSPSLPKAFVFISSVAVYGLDVGTNISENHPLNASEPYGLSKLQAEQLVKDWCEKNNVIYTILRLPLLIGENPHGNLAKMILGIKKGYYINIAGGLAKKSMVLAEDIAEIIPQVAKIGGTYNLTDGYHPNFQELANVIAKELSCNSPKNIPLWLASFIAKCGDMLGKNALFNSYKLAKITSDLTFDDSKARAAFGWKPQPVLKAFKIK